MTKISDLAALTTLATTDLLNCVDVSDTSMAATGTNKKLTPATLATFLTANGFVDTEAAVDAVAAAFAAGSHSNITVTYNDAVGSISLGGSSGGGGGIDIETAVDAVAAAFAAGTHTNITVNYNDAANAISLTASGGGGGITTEDAVDAVAGALVAGANMTVTYNDPAGTITLAAAGGAGGGITIEDAIDAVAAALVAGNNIDITYNDTAGTITVDVEALTKADVGLSNVDNTADASKPLFSPSTTTRGLVPGSSGAAATSFLNATGAWSVPAGGSGGLPAGGTTAQALTKTATTDFAVGWSNVVANVQNVTGIWSGTQAAYDAIGTKSSSVLYFIT